MGRPRRVSHQISLKRLDERNAWILAAATAIGTALVVSLRLQCDSEPLDAFRIAGFIELHLAMPTRE